MFKRLQDYREQKALEQAEWQKEQDRQAAARMAWGQDRFQKWLENQAELDARRKS